jgi:hypothetical protein
VFSLKFASKKDWWLTAIVWGSMLFAIGSGVWALIAEPIGGIGEFLTVLILSILLPVFLLWMWLTTYYVLDESSLIIRFGPFKKTVPLKEIRSVKKTSNPLSSPALSLQRLEIRYGRYDYVLISPKDRDEFMKLLAKKCPNASIEGLRN